MNKRSILNAQDAVAKLERMALELAERLSGNNNPILLVGVRNSGTVIAQKIGELITKHLQNTVTITSVQLDKDHPNEVQLTDESVLNDVNVVLIDDVINSGRTLLYALKPILNFHPKTIQTLVLVERMHKMFPIQPDYVGLSVATTPEDHIKVEVENGRIMGAIVV